MNSVYNALDILVSSSITEGFPNVIAEAMACGVPCVATDVGDTRQIVDDAGAVVPPQRPDLLAEQLLRMIQLSPDEKEALKQRARVRIVNNFGMDIMVTATLTRLRELI